MTSTDGRPEAEIAYVAYQLETEDPAARPVTFVVNGGPGAASAYLQFGVLGPWLLPMDAGRIVPSQPVDLVPNPGTWLDFTDLVFIDPVGTGFSRLIEPNDRLRDRYLSIDGDVEALADVILRWLTQNGRLGSPKYFVGESYGGFRGPLVAEALQTDLGVALDGMTLLSPVLDFGWWQQPDYAPLPKVALLPALAAAAMEESGTFSEPALEAAETYAAGEFVTDLLLGLEDEAAVGRLVDRVSALTGIDREAVARAAGRIDAGAFVRQALRDDGRRISVYDATVASPDPTPESPGGRAADPVLDAMTAPLTSAAIAHYRDTLRWLPDRRYLVLNGGISRAWDWDAGRGQPEAMGALRRVLALDPRAPRPRRARLHRPRHPLLRERADPAPAPRPGPRRAGPPGELPRRPHVLPARGLPPVAARGRALALRGPDRLAAVLVVHALCMICACNVQANSAHALPHSQTNAPRCRARSSPDRR